MTKFHFYFSARVLSDSLSKVSSSNFYLITFDPILLDLLDPLDVSARSGQYSKRVKYKSLLSNWVSWFWGDGSRSNKERMS